VAIDYFLKIDGIEGESTDKDHKGWIDVLSFSLEAKQGRVTSQDFHFVKLIDKASPKLFAASCGGVSPGPAVFATRKAGEGQKDFFVVSLKEVLISSVSISGAGGDPPSETLSLRFASANLHLEGAADAPACVPPAVPGRDHDG